MVGNREALPPACPVADHPNADESDVPPWQYSFPTSSVVFKLVGGAFFVFAYGFFLTILFRNLQLLLTLDGPLTLFNTKSQIPAPGLLAVVPFLMISLAPVALAPASS
jgi:hypothetical protein